MISLTFKKDRGTMKARELSFFILQAIIPAMFALLPAALTVATHSDQPTHKAIERLADGTIILVAFTMLISLSQDLKEAVRPNIHAQVAKLEILLRGAAIAMIGIYAFYQTIVVWGSTGPKNKFPLEVWLTLFAFTMLGFSIYACYISLRTLRPHFNREE